MEQPRESDRASCWIQDQIIQRIHEYAYAKKRKESIGNLAKNLLKHEHPSPIMQACEILSQSRPQALEHASQLFVEIKSCVAANADYEASSRTTELNLTYSGERILLLWKHLAFAETKSSFSAFISPLMQDSPEDTSLLWHSNYLLAHLAFSIGNGLICRSKAMQSLHLAQSLDCPSKIERSEFAFAFAQSTDTPVSRLKDNFVLLRNSVISEQSLLSVSQQHLVMLYSARDFNRREMTASATYILDIVADKFSEMLPEERLYFYLERARCHESYGDSKASRDTLDQARALQASCHKRLLPDLEDVLAKRENIGLAVDSSEDSVRRELLQELLKQYADVTKSA